MLTDRERTAVMLHLAVIVPDGDDLEQIGRAVYGAVNDGRFDDVLPPSRLVSWVDDLRGHAEVADTAITDWLTVLWMARSLHGRYLPPTGDQDLMRRWAEAWEALGERMLTGWDERWNVGIADECYEEALHAWGRLLASQLEGELLAPGRSSPSAQRATSRAMRRRAECQFRLGNLDTAEELIATAAMSEAMFGG